MDRGSLHSTGNGNSNNLGTCSGMNNNCGCTQDTQNNSYQGTTTGSQTLYHYSSNQGILGCHMGSWSMIYRPDNRETRGVATKGDGLTHFRAYQLRSPRHSQPEGSTKTWRGSEQSSDHCPWSIEGYIVRSVGIAGQNKLLELDLLFGGGAGHMAPGLTLIDSGTSHNSLSK